MVRTFLVFILISSSVNAQIFSFGEEKFKSAIPELSKKLKSMEMKSGPQFEEEFNKAVKNVQNAVEEEKLFCSGEAANTEGKTLGKEQKELCFRELKKHYLEAMNVVFVLKKKYLELLHSEHIEKLTEIQKKLAKDIEKNF
jgi:seryl-tRNA synthetase